MNFLFALLLLLGFPLSSHAGVYIDSTPGIFSNPLQLLGANFTCNLIVHDPSSIDPNAATFRMNYATFPGVNLPGSSNNNSVWTFGYNVDCGGGRVNTSEPTLALHFEKEFWAGGAAPAMLEFHVQHIDTTGVQHRPISFTVPRAGGATSTSSSMSINTNKLTFGKYDGTQVMNFDWTTTPPVWDFNITDTVVRHSGNNIKWFQQRNAANSAFLFLPYFDAGNVLRAESPFYVVGTRGGASATFPADFITGQMTGTPTTNDNMLHLAGPTFTGNLYAYEADANITGNFIGALWNNANNTGANALLHLRTIGDSAGNPFIKFDINGTQVASIGLDNSVAGNPFIIAGSATLGTTNLLSIASNGTTAGMMQLTAIVQANLGAPANGNIAYCADCAIANPCAGGGTGALAKRLNGVWVCN